MNKKKISGNMKVMVAQLLFISIVLVVVLVVYPKVEADLNEDSVSFKSINANAIIISSSPDFSNPRYVEVEDNLSLNLKPGTYYWKASNDLLNGFGRSFVVESEVGLDIEDDELTNTGNVILNITETEGGFLVGHIILGPEESSEIENKNDGEYVGRQK
jgi:hypothetical protein